MKKLLVSLFLMVLVLPVVYSLTASIGNAKAIIRVNASPEDPAIIERTILVNNKNDIPVKITVTPAKEFERFVNILDKEFILQPGESKKAEFILTIDRGGTIDGRILVGFSPADPEVKENSVGLASTIIIISEGPIIEEPEETEPEEVMPEEVTGIDEEDVEIETVKENESEGVSVSLGQPKTNEDQDTAENAAKTNNSPNPLVGILIVVVIVAIGICLIFIALKFMKSK